MISIRESIDGIEKAYQVRAAAMDCYLSAIRNISHYAVDIEEGLTAPFKQHVALLADEVAGDKVLMDDSKATLRALLRDYRDKAAQFLERLREDLGSASIALQEIMESFTQSDGDYESRLRTEIGRLREASRTSDVDFIRNSVRSIADTIEASLEQMRQQHRMTVAQFHTEMRVLHQRIAALENAAADSLSKLQSRADVETQLAAAPTGSALLLIRAGGIRLAGANSHDSVAAELTAALARRLRNALPPQADIGMWSPDEFVVLLQTPKPEAAALAKWIAEHLSGSYSCVQDGKAVRHSLQLSVGVVARGEGPIEQVRLRISEFLRGDAATSKKAGPRR